MGSKERQDRERQAVRQSILDAARDLFSIEGYRNVSIRKIAERAHPDPGERGYRTVTVTVSVTVS